jgi:hypothetical protein
MQLSTPSQSRSSPSRWPKSATHGRGSECRSPWPPVTLKIAPAP